jgi:hypothetical protein
MAVSVLSPVNTHTLIPPFFKAMIALSTSSYNLSSMAVAPNKTKSFSRCSATVSIHSSLLILEQDAFL